MDRCPLWGGGVGFTEAMRLYGAQVSRPSSATIHSKSFVGFRAALFSDHLLQTQNVGRAIARSEPNRLNDWGLRWLDTKSTKNQMTTELCHYIYIY